MRNAWKRSFALLLCLVMCLSLFPASAFAEEEASVGEAISLPQAGAEDGGQLIAAPTAETDDPAAVGDGAADPVILSASEESQEPGIPEEDEILRSAQDDTEAEPVRVVFDCDPEDLTLTVYMLDENEEKQIIEPEEDGSYLLLPGEYYYNAECEGFISVEKQIVDFSDVSARTEKDAVVLYVILFDADKLQSNIGTINRTNVSDVNTSGNDLVSFARNYIGVPYVSGGRSPQGFDCCGFVWYVCNHFGINIGSGNQSSQINYGTAISYSKSSLSTVTQNMKVGDLVFFDYGSNGSVDHVAIYTGNGNIINSENSGVLEHSLNQSGWPDGLMWYSVCGIRRVVQDTNLIVLRPCGGTLSNPEFYVDNNTPIGELPTPTLDSYFFTGWYTKPFGGTEVTSSTVVTEDLTLFAHWTHSFRHPLNYDANGGTIPSDERSWQIDGYDTRRATGYMVVYQQRTNPNTNDSGAELAVDRTGRIIAYRPYGQATGPTVPSGGFVVSGHDNDNPPGSAYAFIKGVHDDGYEYIGINYETGLLTAYRNRAAYIAGIRYMGDSDQYGELPVPERAGYWFEGWYADGIKVTAESFYTGGNLKAHWTSAAELAPSASQCSSNHTYELFDLHMTWLQAEAFCEQRGGHLVTITTADEQNAVLSLMNGCSLGMYNIGATDAGSEGTWRWVTGEAFGDYECWDKDYVEPTNEYGEDYAAIIGINNPPNKHVGDWVDTLNDLGGETGFYSWNNCGFICEMDRLSEYTVSYDANGGTGVPSDQIKTHGTPLTLSSVTPTRADSSAGSYTVTLDTNGGEVSPASLSAARTTSYSFSNWNTAANGSGTSYSPGASYTANEAATLYAQWNSSTTTASVSLPTPTREGRTFQGWATSSTATSGMTGSYTPTGNVTLYAIWGGEVTASGVCGKQGDNLTWTLYIDGELVISGTGEMEDYFTNSTGILSPWRDYRDEIHVVSVESGVTIIGNYAFEYFRNLTSVTLPASLTCIGEQSFYGCSALPSITFPSALASIGEFAFFGCSSLTSITLPASLTSIGKQAFSGCSSLTSILVDSASSTFSSVNGVLFNKAKTVLLRCPGGKSGSYIVPTGVAGIGENAFDRCRALTSITLQDGVTSIGEWVFNECTNLTECTIPAGVTSIQSYTFQNCKKLMSITLPDTVTSIGTSAFFACNSLTSITIPAGLTRISSYAFTDCGNLTDVYFGGTVPQRNEREGSGWNSTGNRALFNAQWHYPNCSVHTPGTAVHEHEVEPGCTTTGSYDEVVYCTICAAELSRTAKTVPALGHNWGEWIVTTAATVDHDGVETRTCSRCGAAETRSYTADTVTVTFDANGGSTDTSSMRVLRNGSLSSLPTATRTGYGFNGWYSASSGGTKVTTSTTFSQDTTVYAQWTPITYTVSYNANGGAGEPLDQAKTHDVALTLSSTTPTRANSSAGIYTVTLNANGGSVSPTSLSAARTTSYSFKNWNTAANGSGISYNPGASYTANAAVTLYAQWNSSTATASVNLPTPTRSGYAFLGWAASSTASSGTTGSYTPSGDVTLYAVWKADTYTVSFNANGGTNAPSAQTKTHDVALTLSSDTPTHASEFAGSYTVTLEPNGGSFGGSMNALRTTNYSFKSWNTARDGSGTSYSPGASYTANAGATLYAQWNSSTTTASVNLPTPTREGYTFMGWATSADAESGVIGSYTPSGDVTLYAVWKLARYGKTLTLPAGMTTIESEAFADLPQGVNIVIPDSVENIAKDAFQNSKVIIIAQEDSYAIWWAKRNSIPYIISED